jgi:plastocyanin
VPRLARRALPIGLLLVLALQGSALATTTTVTQTNYQFTPSAASIKIGGTIEWSNTTTSTPHTSTADSSFALWDSGTVNPGSKFDFTFVAAGTYSYHCSFHQFLGMVGTVAVSPIAQPTSGALGTTFHIFWASAAAATGFVYDVQITPPGGSTITKSGLTVRGANIQLPKKGTWQFSARLRKTADNSASAYSPILSVTVT